MKRQKAILFLAVALVAALASSPAAAQAKDYRKIKYPSLEEFKIQKPEVYKLDNRMTIFLLEDHELPLVNVSARIRTGSNYEPVEKTGLAEIFGQVLREGGTQSMTGDEMDEWLAARAAFVETSVSGDVGFASMNSLKEDFDEVFRVFADVLRNPVFAEDKISIALTQAKSAVSRRNDDIGGITGREFTRLIYGTDSPLSSLNEYATLANITRDDLVKWHKRYYHPNSVYLGVVGDFDSAEMKDKIQATLGDWMPRSDAKLPEVPYEKVSKPGVYFIEKEDTTQAHIRMGHLGIKTDNPDYFSVKMMNEVLGGGFAGRLFSNVRSEKGLAYSVFGGVGDSFVREGIFQAGMSTKSETMFQAVEALKEELRGIIDNPPSATEMQRARESILNSFVFNYDSKAKILNQQMLYAYYGMPADFLETYRSNIEKVTQEDVARVAKKYVHPDKLALLVVGKSADFDKPMDTFGTVQVVDISIPPPPDIRPVVEKNEATLAAGAAVLAKSAESMSVGAGEPIGTAAMSYTLELSVAGNTMSIDQDVEMELPGKIRQTMKTPMGEQVIVVNGKRGYMAAGGQSMVLPGEQVKDTQKSMGRELLVLLSSTDDPELEAVAMGSEDVDGTACDVVAVSYMGSESRLYVAPDGKVVKQTFQGKHPFQGTPGLMEVRYFDYGDKNGQLFPHTQTISFEGEQLAKITLKDLRVNPDLDPALFEIRN